MRAVKNIDGTATVWFLGRDVSTIHKIFSTYKDAKSYVDYMYGRDD